MAEEYKPLNSKQVKNVVALSHIGSPANDTLDDILSKIDTAIASGGGGSAGYSGIQALSSGVSSVTVTFPAALPATNYTVNAVLGNLTDANPQYQSVDVITKTTAGFTATWNAPTDSANYFLDWIVPNVQNQIGEQAISSGAVTVTISLPFTLSATNYVVIPCWVNLVDANPQYQPIETSAKTNTSFTLTWNAPTDSANYRISYQVAVSS